MRAVVSSLVILCLFTASVYAVEGAHNEQIAFTSEFGGELFIMDVPARASTKLDLGLSGISELAYNRALNNLVFSASKHGKHSIFMLRLPGHSPVRLPYHSVDNSPYRPTFDPEGKNVYAVNYFGGVFGFNLSRQRWEHVLVEGVTDFHPQGLAFSPSGHFVSISPGQFKGFLIADVKPDRFTVVRSVLDDFDSCTSAQWIDDNTIIFAGRRAAGLQFLWELDLATGVVRQLTHAPIGSRDFLSISKDAKKIIFTGTDEGKPLEWAIWLLPLDTLEPTKLTSRESDESFLFPAWLDR